MRRPRRPPRVRIAGEEELIAELRRRCAPRGARTIIAVDSGQPVSVVSNVKDGRRPCPASIAAVLGYRLAWVRSDEQFELPIWKEK